jgi:hypothetical protein
MGQYSRATWWLPVLLVTAVAPPVAAQVGHPPERSPYRDLEYTQEWTFFGGYFNPRKDRVGVAPQAGDMYGGRWDLRIGGPAYLFGRVATASLAHRVIDPKQPIGKRDVGSVTLPILFTDAGFGMNLTGFKTWHGLVPEVLLGGGTTADLRGRADVGKYKFGVPFTLTFGGAVKWVPAGRWQVRADWSNYVYQIRYPETYFLRVGTDDPVLLPGAVHSSWYRNSALQLGLSYLYHR